MYSVVFYLPAVLSDLVMYCLSLPLFLLVLGVSLNISIFPSNAQNRIVSLVFYTNIASTNTFRLLDGNTLVNKSARLDVVFS